MNLKSILNAGAVLVVAAAAATATAAVTPPIASSREYVMGTFAEVRVYDAPAGDAAAAIEAAMGELRAVDRLMAVQRPDSDVTRLNRDGATGPVAVDARVIEVLEAGLEVGRLTDGAFDMTVLPVVRAWGFIDGTPHRPDVRPPKPAGPAAIRIDATAGTVRFTDAGAQVDLGGIAKGYALDRARDALRARAVRSAWLDLGGQIATLGAPPDGPRWRIALRHPRRAGEWLGVVEMDEASLSTSGDAEQFEAEPNGHRVAHIVDPRSGAPIVDAPTVAVIAPSATQADALSTAAVVLGTDRARALLPRMGADGVLADVDREGRITVSVTPNARFERTAS
jgi:thiamine biosynthesis lipoprotein